MVMTGYDALCALAKAVEDGGTIPAELRELVKLRCSQINGCTYCTRLHSIGQRARHVPAWRTHPAFTDRERAAFGLAEAVTLVHDGQVPQDVLDRAVREFGEAGATELIWIAIVINSFNRLAISTRLG